MAVVFHAATAAPSVQNAQTEALMMAVNVEGTQHVVQACQRQRVPKLIYLSSASVVWDGRDLVDVDETLPYARRNPDFYARTKVRCRLLVHPTHQCAIQGAAPGRHSSPFCAATVGRPSCIAVRP